jgi:hypothetical protein
MAVILLDTVDNQSKLKNQHLVKLLDYRKKLQTCRGHSHLTTPMQSFVELINKGSM